MQEKETTNPDEFTDLRNVPATGRILCLDPGTKRVGVAVCDELRITTRPLEVITLESWKKLLVRIKDLLAEYDAAALVIGLPLAGDGSESEMSVMARDWQRKFALSLEIGVYLQDERSTSYEAKSRLWQQGVSLADTKNLVDSEAAAIILSDFLSRL